jgi:hypothetical protein
MRFGGEGASLPRFEVHDVGAFPGDIALAVVVENAFAALAQHHQGNSEATVGGFGSSDRLKKQVDWQSAIHGGELGTDVGEAGLFCLCLRHRDEHQSESFFTTTFYWIIRCPLIGGSAMRVQPFSADHPRSTIGFSRPSQFSTVWLTPGFSRIVMVARDMPLVDHGLRAT